MISLFALLGSELARQDATRIAGNGLPSTLPFPQVAGRQVLLEQTKFPEEPQSLSLLQVIEQ